MKYSDVISTIALVLSLGAVYVTYHENELNRAETSKPRVSVDVAVDQNRRPAQGDWASLFYVRVDVKNVGQSPARDVRAVASLIHSNSPEYAYDQYLKSPACSVPVANLAATLYTGNSHGALFGLSPTTGSTTFTNPKGDYFFRGISVSNQPVQPYVMGCITYKVDDSSTPMTEGFVFGIDATCVDGQECGLEDDHSNHGATKSISLMNVIE